MTPLLNSMAMAKAMRSGLINEYEWMRSRHSDELALSLSTTLTSTQHTQLLQYIQALRTCMDPGITDPTKIVWPTKPSFLA